MAVLAKWTLSEMSRSIVSPCAGTHPTLNSTCAEKTTCHAWILFTATPSRWLHRRKNGRSWCQREFVIAGPPSGTAPPLQDKALVKASLDGVLVVKSRRSSAGRQYIHAKDVDTGIISADNLNPQKARILAMLALATAEDRNEIRRMFLEY